jgi:hypothetical protein
LPFIVSPSPSGESQEETDLIHQQQLSSPPSDPRIDTPKHEKRSLSFRSASICRTTINNNLIIIIAIININSLGTRSILESSTIYSPQTTNQTLAGPLRPICSKILISSQQ